MAPTRTTKPDAILLAAVDLAREAAVETAGVMGVGEHLGHHADAERVLTHFFACPHPAYRGWRWSVTVARASRAKVATLDEVVLLPADGALLAQDWVPWAERIQPGDVTPGLLMPTPADDPRLEPGYTGGERAADTDPAEAGQARAVVAELGLGRERVLSRTAGTRRPSAGSPVTADPTTRWPSRLPARARPAGSSCGCRAGWASSSAPARTASPPPTARW